MDGGGSWHMIKNEKERRLIIFKDDVNGRTIDQGNISNENSSLMENMLLIDGWKYNLLCIDQLCDEGFKLIFQFLFMHHKRNGNSYIIDIKKIQWS